MGSFSARGRGVRVFAMAFFPKPHPYQRARRHKLSAPTQIVFVHGGHQTRGKLYVISDTGGCAGVESHLAPSTLVHLQVPTSAGTISAIAEMLRPLDASRQAFRFLAMDDADLSRLQDLVAH